MTYWIKISALCFLIVSSFSNAEGQEEEPGALRIPMPISGTNQQYNYFQWLLQSALDVTAAEYGEMKVVPGNTPTTLARQMRLLDANKVDVMWSVSTPERERSYVSVDFPLYGDVFSYRVIVIRKNDQRFNQAISLDEIKQYVAVQGNDWPDLATLRSNGFSVEGSDYPYAFKLLSSGFVDYFPRAAVEVCEELSLRPDLTLLPGHLIAYPNTMKFLLNRGNSKLAERIKQGLTKLFHSGKLIKKLSTMPSFVAAIPVIRRNNANIHQLTTANQSYYSHPFSEAVRRVIADIPDDPNEVLCYEHAQFAYD